MEDILNGPPYPGRTLYFTSRPDGLCGNDDCGQMSAWYVMSAIGLYPVTLGSGIYVLSAPVSGQTVLSLGDGRQLTIKAICKGGDINSCRYISAVRLNGQDYSRSYIRYSDIRDGRELELALVPEPDYSFGTAVEDRPVSRLDKTGFVRNHWFEAPGGQHRGRAGLHHPDPGLRAGAAISGRGQVRKGICQEFRNHPFMAFRGWRRGIHLYR